MTHCLLVWWIQKYHGLVLQVVLSRILVHTVYHQHEDRKACPIMIWFLYLMQATVNVIGMTQPMFRHQTNPLYTPLTAMKYADNTGNLSIRTYYNLLFNYGSLFHFSLNLLKCITCNCFRSRVMPVWSQWWSWLGLNGHCITFWLLNLCTVILDLGASAPTISWSYFGKIHGARIYIYGTNADTASNDCQGHLLHPKF